MPTPLIGTWVIYIGSVRSTNLSGGCTTFDLETYVCPLGSISQVTATDTDIFNGMLNRADGLAILCFATFADGSFSIKFNNSSDIILNEGTANEETIPTVSVPSGFTITSAALAYSGSIRSTSGGFGFTNVITATQDLQALSPTSTITDTICFAPGSSIAFDITSATPTLLTARIITGFGPEINFDISGVGGGEYFGISNDAIWLTGDYEIISYQFNVDPPQRTVQPGDEITVTSDPGDPTAADLTKVLTLDILCLDDNENLIATIPIPQVLWVTNTVNLWVFILPAFPVSNFITLQITSTEFSGVVDLITLYPIYFYDAPGLYRLVPGQTHDIIYDRIDFPPTIGTYLTKIPNPYGKTGFF